MVGGGIFAFVPGRRERITVDHLRAATFIACDGTEPSNKHRGYILRRLLRRAFVHGKLLGLSWRVGEYVVAWYIKNYSEAYPELAANREKILSVILERGKKVQPHA